MSMSGPVVRLLLALYLSEILHFYQNLSTPSSRTVGRPMYSPCGDRYHHDFCKSNEVYA